MTRKCKANGCEVVFDKRRRNQEYCSNRCRNRQNSRVRQRKVRAAIKKMDEQRSEVQP